MAVSKSALRGGWAFPEFWALGTAVLHDSHPDHELARRLYMLEALEAPPPSLTEPFTLPWFLEIEKHRHSRHGRWIPKIFEFTKHRGETLLGLGDGLGTDWVQYAQHGAAVVVCTSSRPQLGLVRRNFEVRGLEGRFLEAHPSRLPLESATIDVACISSLHLGVDSPRAMVDEVYRVLKPGGKVLAVTAAKYNIDYVEDLCCFWRRWTKTQPMPQAGEKGTTGPELRRLFERFADHRIYKRHLRRAEVPTMWRWLPVSVLARLVGKVLAVKAFKPFPGVAK